MELIQQGAIAVPLLLKELGVDFILLNDNVNGNFAHNPEPLPENLIELSKTVRKNHADMGISVDPDVDRLCFVCENGQMFGEEYTLVAVAAYMLSKQKGSTVSNLSSSRALKDITAQYECSYYASAVGEVNVVAKMKQVNAVIGGEGNGGVIVPDFHYGRDALIGIALFLTAFSRVSKKMSDLKNEFPQYIISKEKLVLKENTDFNDLVKKVAGQFESNQVNTEDGLKIDFENGWVHLRKSNTEPIVRMYVEANSVSEINIISSNIKNKIIKYINI